MVIPKKKEKYIYTLRFPFEAFDALDARLTVRTILDQLGETDRNCEEKLQKVFPDKAPEKIKL